MYASAPKDIYIRKVQMGTFHKEKGSRICIGGERMEFLVGIFRWSCLGVFGSRGEAAIPLVTHSVLTLPKIGEKGYIDKNSKSGLTGELKKG